MDENYRELYMRNSTNSKNQSTVLVFCILLVYINTGLDSVWYTRYKRLEKIIGKSLPDCFQDFLQTLSILLRLSRTGY